MRLLVTGFPPFPNRPVNPTQALVEAVQRGEFSLPGVTVRGGMVPVEYSRVESDYLKLLRAFRPDLVLSFGVARQRPLLRLERRGVNIDQAKVPDNRGEFRSGSRILPRGPAEIHSPHKLPALRQHLRNQGLAADISDNAGTYLCNHLTYFGMHQAARVRSAHRFLFTHVSARSSPNHQKRLLRALHIMAAWFHNQHQ